MTPGINLGGLLRTKCSSYSLAWLPHFFIFRAFLSSIQNVSFVPKLPFFCGASNCSIHLKNLISKRKSNEKKLKKNLIAKLFSFDCCRVRVSIFFNKFAFFFQAMLPFWLSPLFTVMGNTINRLISEWCGNSMDKRQEYTVHGKNIYCLIFRIRLAIHLTNWHIKYVSA